MKAIAMKCTQEQFDAIKDKLVGMKINGIIGFKDCGYLVTNYGGEEYISNLPKSFVMNNNREIHETWNEEIFLNACGIETERIFKGSELQYYNHGKWFDTSSDFDYRLKPANLIKKQELESQILELQNQLKNL
jgi:hypothetical protein